MGRTEQSGVRAARSLRSSAPGGGQAVSWPDYSGVLFAPGQEASRSLRKRALAPASSRRFTFMLLSPSRW